MRKKLWLSGIFLLVDLFSKALAWVFLATRAPVRISDDLSFQFAVNRMGYGSVAKNFNLNHDVTLFLLSCLLVLYSVAVLVISRFIRKKWLRVLLYSAAFIAVAVINAIVEHRLPSMTLGPTVVGIVSKVGPALLALTVISLAKDKIYLILWSLVLGAGVGNMVSLILPPFGTIDFIYSIFLNKVMGAGIFNLADLMIDLFYVGMVLYSLFLLLYGAVRRVIRWRGRQNSQ